MTKFLLIALLFSNSILFAQDTIYTIAYTSLQAEIYFEDRDTSNYIYIDTNQNNLWQIGSPTKSYFDSSFSLPLALVTDTINSYPKNNISSFEFVIYSDDATYINFWHKLDTDTLNDGGTVEVSTDGGITWKNIIDDPEFILYNFYDNSGVLASTLNYGFSGTWNWTESTIYGYALNYVRFRFTFTSDNNDSNKDGWMIDNFNISCIGTGVEEELLKQKINIYPNPTNDLIYLDIDKTIQVEDINIFDISGKLLIKTISNEIDIANLKNGIYILQIKSNSGIISRKIIKNAL